MRQIETYIYCGSGSGTRAFGLPHPEEADVHEAVLPRRRQASVRVRLLPSVTRSYVITDFTSESILKMKSHKWYADFVSQGVVDFAVVDCEDIPSVVLAFLRNA